MERDKEESPTNKMSNDRGPNLSPQPPAKRSHYLMSMSCDEIPCAALLTPQVSSRSNSILFSKFAALGAESSGRLATYWSRRLQIFGEKSCLPMHQTGDGALSPAEVCLLQNQEQWMVLPSDINGRSVFFVDCASSFGGTAEERQRCLFYLVSTAIQEARQDEVKVIIALPEDDSSAGLSNDVIDNIDCFFSFLFLLPLHLEQVHFVAVSDQQDMPDFLETFKDNLGPKIRPKSKVHVAGTTAELVVALGQEGFHRMSLPVSVGGFFSHQNSLEWHRLQTEVESLERPLSVSDVTQHTTASQYAIADLNEKDSEETSVLPAAVAAVTESSPSCLGAGDEKLKDFVRKRNAMYARRKYARRKIEIEVLKSQCQDLQNQKHDLMNEHNRLQDLIRGANQYVAIFESSDGRDPRLRDSLKSPETAPSPASTKVAQLSSDGCTSGDHSGAPPSLVQAIHDSSGLSTLNQQPQSVPGDGIQGSDILHLLEQLLQDQTLHRPREALQAPQADSSAARALDLASALLQQSPDQELLLRLASLQQNMSLPPQASSQASTRPSIHQLLSQHQNLLAAAQALSQSSPNCQAAIADLLFQEEKRCTSPKHH